MLNYTTTLLAAEAEEAGIGALGVSLKAILLQTATFILLFFLVKKFASQKIVDTLNDRRKTIDEGLVNAEKADKSLRQAKKVAQTEVDNARAEGQDIVNQANEQSGEIVQAARDQSQKEQEQMVEQGYAKIEQERTKAAKQLQTEATQLVSAAAAAVLGEKLDSKQDSNLINQSIKKEMSKEPTHA